MLDKTNKTYWVKIYLSGPIEEAKQIIRKECFNIGLCVTIDPTLFIYTGGEEFGYVVGLINYPRFPATPKEIWNKAKCLAMLLLDQTYQQSALIMDSKNSNWISKRKEE